MVNSLTKQKLNDTVEIDNLNRQIQLREAALKEFTKLDGLSIENESLKRQVQSLTEDNDSLLSKMDSLGKNTVPTIAIGELKAQMEKLQEEFKTVSNQLDEKLHEIKSLQEIVGNNSTKIKKLIQENSDLKESLDMSPLSQDQVKLKYDKLIKKLKLYREKIFDISEQLKLLKYDRRTLLETTKEYSVNVNKWQKDIINASTKLIERIKATDAELESKSQEIQRLESIIAANNDSVNNSAVQNDSSKKELELEIQKLNDVIRSKDKSLNEEREAQKKLKLAIKKTSVLSLEMEAYEKTLDDMNNKLEAKKSEVIDLESNVKIQNVTMESLKNQIIQLEENLASEKQHSQDIKRSLDSQQSLLRKTEHERTESNLQLELLNKNYEALKMESNETKLEMAKHVNEMEKRYQLLETERNGLLTTTMQLESELDKYKKKAAANEKEFDDLRADFASYKIRAQNVLRQSQTKDVSKEHELQDEIMTMQASVDALTETNIKISKELENLKKNYRDLNEDNDRLQNRCKDLLHTLEKHSEEYSSESTKRNQEHEDSIKNHKLQIETLNAFYKKKIQDLEDAKNSSVKELREKRTKVENCRTSIQQTPTSSTPVDNLSQQTSDEQKLNMLLMAREEAEGSEDQSSHAYQVQQRRKTSRNRELMPLDELLNSSLDDNYNEMSENSSGHTTLSSPSELLEQMRAKLVKEENRVKHLTALLADSEKDLARIQQLNDMLKEEVRRYQRSADREPHLQNTEYLKNIVIKFTTLNNGDEKQRLIPVLNTILKLSAEENQMLQNACKITTGGWGGLFSK